MTVVKAYAGCCLLMVLGAFSMLPGGAPGAEPNDTFATAERTTPGLHSGQLNYSGGAGDRYDYYKFAVAGGQRFAVNGSAGTGAGIQFHLADPDQAFIMESSWLAAGSCEVLKYALGSADAGDFFLWFEIGGADEWANYSFELSISNQSDAGQAGDAGDTNNTARTITPGTYGGWLGVEDWEDYYMFSVPNGCRIELGITPGDDIPAGGRMKLELDRPDSTFVNSTAWHGPALSATLLHQTSSATGGDYYVWMSYMTAGGNYTFTLALVPENDAGSGADAAGGLDAGPYMLPGGGAYDGILHDDDQVDRYGFNVTAGQIISCNLTVGMAESDWIKYVMYRPDRTEFQRSEWINPGDGKQIGLVTNNSGAGAWFLEVEGRNSYTFRLTLVDQNDGNISGDAGDTIATARPIRADVDYTGRMGDDDKEDYFSFNCTAESKINVSYTFYNGFNTGRVILVGPDGVMIHIPDAVGAQWPTFFVLTLEDTGVHCLLVEAVDLEYRFNLTVAAKNDTRLPVVAVTSPADGTTMNMSSIDLAGTASDDSAVAGVELSLDGATWMNATGTTSWTFSGLVLSEGNNTIRARATDTSGNRNTTSLLVRYRPPAPSVNDTERPRVVMLTPANGFNTKKPKLPQITCNATDNVGVTKVELIVNGRPVAIASAGGNWTARNVPIQEGRNVITVTVMDAAGNRDSETIEGTYELPDPGFEAFVLVAALAIGVVLIARKRKR